MPDVKWIKVSTDMFDGSRKIKQIELMPEGDTILVIWLKLLLLAGNVNDGGAIYLTPEIPYTDEMLANELRRPITTVRMALSIFERFGMIEIVDDILHLSAWEKYQNTDRLAEIREQTRARVAKCREKKRLTASNVTSNATVTHGNDVDIDIDKDKEIETDNIPLAHSGGETAAQKAEKTIDAKKKFEIFWSAYPRKTGKGKAETKFLSIKPSDELFEQMMSALKEHKSSEEWTRDGGQYIPYPATWLHQRRWEDEPDAPAQSSSQHGSFNIFAQIQEQERRYGG